MKSNHGTNHTADSTTTADSTNATAAEHQQQNETLSMLMLMVSECIVFGVLPLLIMVYCTIQYQCRIVSKLILITMILYGISYSILRYFANHICKLSLQPKLSSWVVTVPVVVQQQGSAKQEQQEQKIKKKKLQYAASSEWRSRLLAILNAILLIYGCLFCFMEWSAYIPESKGWVFTKLESESLLESLESLSDSTSSINSLRNNNPVIFYASLFLGYLQWDILWLLYHRKDQSSSNFIGTLIHHLIFISISQYVLSGTYFCKPFAWLSLTELSTPFLHIRWLLAATGSKDKNENYQNVYYYISLCFAITFIVTRVIGYGLGLIDIWMSGYQYWSPINGLKYGVIIGLHLGYILNLFWSIKVISALFRAISKKSKSKSNKKSNEKSD
jgi:heme/copper-type cytochrome/quinol oxidase subunit 3